jgi:hypothetical protein
MEMFLPCGQDMIASGPSLKSRDHQDVLSRVSVGFPKAMDPWRAGSRVSRFKDAGISSDSILAFGVWLSVTSHPTNNDSVLNNQCS